MDVIMEISEKIYVLDHGVLIAEGSQVRFRGTKGLSSFGGGLMLEVIDLHVNYGGITALRGINLTIKENQIVTLIGANGAGKSSTLRSIMGLVPKASGKIVYKGEDFTNLPTKDLVAQDCHGPGRQKVFADLTVEKTSFWGLHPV